MSAPDRTVRARMADQPAFIWRCEAVVGAGLLAVMILVSRRLPLHGTE